MYVQGWEASRESERLMQDVTAAKRALESGACLQRGSAREARNGMVTLLLGHWQ